jgi:hypothetical protein
MVCEQVRRKLCPRPGPWLAVCRMPSDCAHHGPAEKILPCEACVRSSRPWPRKPEAGANPLHDRGCELGVVPDNPACCRVVLRGRGDYSFDNSVSLLQEGRDGARTADSPPLLCAAGNTRRQCATGNTATARWPAFFLSLHQLSGTPNITISPKPELLPSDLLQAGRFDPVTICNVPL